MALRKEITVEYLNEGGKNVLPGELGMEVLTLEEGRLTSRMALQQKHMAINGFLDAVVTDEVSGKTLALFRCTQMILW